MARLTAVITQIVEPSIPPKRLAKIAKRLAQDETSRAFFTECYEVADRFNLSDAYLEARHVQWLGYSRMDGQARADHFLLTDDFHHTTVLHHHIAFEGELEPKEYESRDWQNAVETLHELYWQRATSGGPPNTTAELEPFGREVASKDTDLWSASRGLYVSLYDAEQNNELLEWEEIAPAIYSLLYLHVQGFEQQHAYDRLKDQTAQSTRFSILFFNGDAILSLSYSYPYLQEPGHTAFPLSSDSVAAESELFSRRRADPENRFEAYDLLPEYPALRYMGLALLEFAANAQFGQWHIRTLLDRISQDGRGRGALKVTRATGDIDRLYYRSTSLSKLRLIVTREIAVRVIAEQELAPNERAIDGMKASLLNALVTIIAAAAFIAAVTQVVLALR